MIPSSGVLYKKAIIALIIISFFPAWALITGLYKPIPAWLMINRFSITSHPETIIDIDYIDFNTYPKLQEAFEVEISSRNKGFPHPYEWVNCTHSEGKEIVKLFGGEYKTSDEDYQNYYFDIRYQNQNYSITIVFSWKPPPID